LPGCSRNPETWGEAHCRALAKSALVRLDSRYPLHTEIHPACLSGCFPGRWNLKPSRRHPRIAQKTGPGASILLRSHNSTAHRHHGEFQPLGDAQPSAINGPGSEERNTTEPSPGHSLFQPSALPRSLRLCRRQDTEELRRIPHWMGTRLQYPHGDALIPHRRRGLPVTMASVLTFHRMLW
jgi:hypothetical protein